MNIILFIIKKFLLSSKNKNNDVSKLSFFSLVIVSIGVAVPLLVISITNGFQNTLKEKIENYNFDIIGFARGLLYKEDVNNIDVDTEEVVKAGFYEDKVIIRSNLGLSRISNIRAFSSEEYKSLSMFKTYKVLAGDYYPSEGGIVIAENLAINLGVGIGDEVQILSVDSSLGYKNFSIKKLRISGIVSHGYADADIFSSFILNTEMPKIFYIEQNVINRIGLKLKKSTEESVKNIFIKLKDRLGNYKLKSMYENKIFEDFKEEKTLLTISMLIILFISFVVIFITINVLIVDKKFDIALLNVIGLREDSIIKIFLFQSVIIITIGSILGFIFGGFITKNIEKIIVVFETFINNILTYLNLLGINIFPHYYRYSLMPEDKFYLTSLPYKFLLEDFLIIGCTAILVGVTSSLLTYRKIKLVNTSSLLRNE
ncbi:MAG TPA: ABC transporter permease [Spirochaetota bacterium]|nr:ABC transporter permease [Spirochaetota bacterium]HOM38226.1 ABC transporter permease [Spirochaetota bacterium]HPQ48556.1 ABC transporter permease [Spirochaetota bacterium]